MMTVLSTALNIKKSSVGRRGILLLLTIFFAGALAGCKRTTYLADSENSSDDDANFTIHVHKQREVVALSAIGTGTVGNDIHIWEPNGVFTLLAVSLDDDAGVALYRTDGTSEGTTLLKEYRKPGYSVFSLPAGSLYKNNYYFEIRFRSERDDEADLKETWISDGTVAGTVPTKTAPFSHSDTVADSDHEFIFMAETEEIYFWIVEHHADDMLLRYNTLWRSNEGSTTPVQIVKEDGTPLRLSGYFRYINELSHQFHEEHLYFLGINDESENSELRRVALNSTMSELLHAQPNTLLCGSQDSTQFATVNNHLLFTFCDVTHGMELWHTDGTVEGTRLFQELKPGEDSAWLDSFTLSANLLYFVYRNPGLPPNDQDDQMWRTDGTPQGTFMVADISSPIEVVDFEEPMAISYNMFADKDGAIYWDMPFGGSGGGIWRSDGTVVGTISLTPEIIPKSVRTHLTDKQLYFTYEDSDSGEQLAMIDLENNLITHLLDVRRGTAGREGEYPELPLTGLGNFKTINNNISVFTADDGVHGNELWSTNGTADGTAILKDINQRKAAGFVEGLSGTENRFYFRGNDQIHGKELWVTDLNDATLTRITDSPQGLGFDRIGPFLALKDRGIFATVSRTWENALWGISTNSPLGTSNIEFLQTFEQPPNGMVAASDGFGYFHETKKQDKSWHCVLWKTDGTAPGTTISSQVPCDHNSQFSPETFFTWKQFLFFAQPTEEGNTEVRVIDGAADNAQLLDQSITAMHPVGTVDNKLLFFAQGVSAESESTDPVAWLTNGSAKSTVPYNGLPNNRDGFKTHTWFPWLGDLYFVYGDGNSEEQLWHLKGNTLEAERIQNITWKSGPGNFHGTDQYLYFTASLNENTGRGLWRLKKGTTTLKPLPEVRPGPESAYPTHLLTTNGTTFFWAYTSNTEASLPQQSLMRVTPEGEVLLVSNVLESPRNGDLIFSIGCDIYFVSSDNQIHYEIWELNGCNSTLQKFTDFKQRKENAPTLLYQTEERILFSATDGTRERELFLIR